MSPASRLVLLALAVFLGAACAANEPEPQGGPDEQVTLELDTATCANSGFLAHDGEIWSLSEAVPEDLRGVASLSGTLAEVQEPGRGLFIATNGLQLEMERGFSDPVCEMWA